VLSAIEKGFEAIGFSSHSMLPSNRCDWCLTASKIVKYREEIISLREKYKDKIKVHLGVEADFIPDTAYPSYEEYADLAPEYIIGSVHFVAAESGALVAVDNTPEELFKGIKDSFGGSAEKFIKAYYSSVRQMVGSYDFDIIGHVDLVRKFNSKHPYFDESSAWYLDEIAKTADVIVSSGKLVEINTGAISRGWMNDVYPSLQFRKMLAERGVKFILSSDSHHASSLDTGFDKVMNVDFNGEIADYFQ
jgi:histidinol-phosphatase (PHP family)